MLGCGKGRCEGLQPERSQPPKATAVPPASSRRDSLLAPLANQHPYKTKVSITYNNRSGFKPSISENISSAAEVKSFLSVRTCKYMRQTVSWHEAAEVNALGRSYAD